MLPSILLLALLVGVDAFRPSLNLLLRRNTGLSASTSIRVEKDEKSVGVALCKILEEEYSKTLAGGKSSFIFGISGGSMLKMLANLQRSEVMDLKKCTCIFISHRCVPNDDDGATYHKSRPLFMDNWVSQGLNLIVPNGSSDASESATYYEAELKKLSRDVLPMNQAGYPVFDLLLIGMGIDGHVGSIYPNSPEADDTSVVVAVTGKKMSLSLTSMLASKTNVVAVAGKSSKAPLGKAEATVRALERDGETRQTFPAVVLRDQALWLLDEDSAALLKRK